MKIRNYFSLNFKGNLPLVVKQLLVTAKAESISEELQVNLVHCLSCRWYEYRYLANTLTKTKACAGFIVRPNCYGAAILRFKRLKRSAWPIIAAVRIESALRHWTPHCHA